MSRCLMLLAALLLSGCASYGGSGLVVGQSVEGDVMQRMGEPAMQWTNEDGSRLLAYPRGSGGHTFMVQIGRDGKLDHIENVLSSAGFSRIRAGMNMDQVLRTLGPPNPAWTVYFKEPVRPLQRPVRWHAARSAIDPVAARGVPTPHDLLVFPLGRFRFLHPA